MIRINIIKGILYILNLHGKALLSELSEIMK